jgi:hypothetical protein
VHGDSPDERIESLLVRAESATASSIWILGFGSVADAQSWNADLAERRARTIQDAMLHTRTGGQLTARIKIRGLGADVLSGLATPQQLASEQVAVAFLCLPPAHHEDTLSRLPAEPGAPPPASSRSLP